MIKIICFMGHVNIKSLTVKTDPSSLEAMNKNSLDVSPLENALAYVNIFKESVPALIGLGEGMVRLGEKRTKASMRLADLAQERELKSIEVEALTKEKKTSKTITERAKDLLYPRKRMDEDGLGKDTNKEPLDGIEEK